MTRHWSPLAVVYLLLAIVGLVGTWWFNIRAIAESRNYLGDLVTSGPAVSSITVDLLVVAVAGSVFIIIEARRLGMRLGWLYVVGAGLTAFAFTFPLFLAMRQRALRERAATSDDVSDAAHAQDAAGRSGTTGPAASGDVS